METLDDDGITELCLLVLATDEVGVNSVLKALKPYVKVTDSSKICRLY